MTRADWDPRNLPDLSGRTYLVTGATRGLGFFACEQIAAAGAYVLLTGRSPHKLQTAKEAVKRTNPDASIETLLLDTSNLGSVRAAAATARARGRLDGLLLNAGIVHPPKTRETAGGHELVFATNVLGHFALAGEMLKPLAAARGRMVWVGSMSTSLWNHVPTDPELVEGYSPWRAYVQSKAATTALGLEADRRLRAHSVPVESLIAHPGYSTSGRTRGIRGVNEPSRLSRFVDNLQAPITQSKEQGAWSLVRALVDPTAEGGTMYGPTLVARGLPRPATPSRRSRGADLGADLWQHCETATHVRWPFDRARRAAS
ncbi:dehydrogenase [Microbacterium testaceum]|uniref:SDR family NAD(P)-dependent oxidoreductase n=1 Tax=Microbacterium testaceum TaxID=2033 RepID=UPI000734831F|nr:SDR family NAD(P)-dependent oxidoreductase [Microbacterium testaceum]KTS70288.1 dehydrogenase [Microbacterium testaceum]